MADSTGRLVRIALRVGMAAIFALPALSMPAVSANAQTPTRTLNGIEVSGRFLEVWNTQGNERDSVYVNGLPITARRSEISVDDGRAYDTQWFERARYEAHPGVAKPYDVLLGRLGANRVEGRGKLDPATGKVANPGDEPFVGVDRPPDLSAIKLWFPETRHTLSGKLLDYWNRYGGISQFGFPLSEPFQEVSQTDGKPYTVQYFERNRFEMHPEKPAPYDVELGLLGVEQYKMLAVAGDTLPVAPPKDVKSAKDEIAIGMTQEPRNLSLFDNSEVTRRVRSLIEDQLVGRDDNDNLFPLNAWYVPTLENGGAQFIGEGDDRYLRVKYKLRQGIKWSDGVELTSNDAIFAYRLIMNSDLQAPNRSEYVRLQTIDNPDKYTVIYNYRSLNQLKTYWNSILDKKNYGFLYAYIDQKKPLTSRGYSEVGTIYPEHVLGQIPPAKIPTDPISSAPIGTGPYKVELWSSGQEMSLVPNEYYSLTAKPAIKKISIKFILNYSLDNLRGGQFDMLTSEAFNGPPGKYDVLTAWGYKVADRLGAIWEHLDFRFDYAPFKERAVREAIFRAINRQRVADIVYSGAGAVMNSVIPPGVYYSLQNPDFAKNYPDIAAKYKLPIYSYDPERARQLLDTAGWFVGPDGIRTKGGVKLSFIYGTTTSAARQLMQYLVAADLKAVGVEAVTKNYPSSVFFAGDDTDPNATGIIKLSQFSYVTTRESDFGVWTCKYSDYGMFPYAPIGYCNSALDAANFRFTSEPDPQAQVAAAAEAQVILMQDIVVIPLLQRPIVEIVRRTIANYKLPNTTTSSFWNIRQWYFR